MNISLEKKENRPNASYCYTLENNLASSQLVLTANVWTYIGAIEILNPNIQYVIERIITAVDTQTTFTKIALEYHDDTADLTGYTSSATVPTGNVKFYYPGSGANPLTVSGSGVKLLEIAYGEANVQSYGQSGIENPRKLDPYKYRGFIAIKVKVQNNTTLRTAWANIIEYD